jgi:hypothetical protein
MKHLKRFNEVSNYSSRFHGATEDVFKRLLSRFDEGILNELIQNYFEDEFDYLNCFVENSRTSEGMENSIHYGYITPKSAKYLMENSFMLDFCLDYPRFSNQRNITPILGKLKEQLEIFEQVIKSFDLKIAYDEYGLGESNYEVFISDINFQFDPQMK